MAITTTDLHRLVPKVAVRAKWALVVLHKAPMAIHMAIPLQGQGARALWDLDLVPMNTMAGRTVDLQDTTVDPLVGLEDHKEDTLGGLGDRMEDTTVALEDPKEDTTVGLEDHREGPLALEDRMVSTTVAQVVLAVATAAQDRQVKATCIEKAVANLDHSMADGKQLLPSRYLS